MVADVVGRWECPLWFVGDLDAFDLLVFLHRRMQLQAAGVRFEECGQTARDNGWVNADLLPGVLVNSGANFRIVQLVQDVKNV